VKSPRLKSSVPEFDSRGRPYRSLPGKSVRQFLADGFEDADARQLLEALGKCFLLALGLLLRRRLVAIQSHGVVTTAQAVVDARPRIGARAGVVR